ncbi:FAR1-related sequence 5-like protein [Tanacetum coccineum]
MLVSIPFSPEVARIYGHMLSDEEECPTCHFGILDVTPRGFKYWIPDVEDKPVEGGFEIKRGGQHNDVRLHGLKKAKSKYFYYVREGLKAWKPIVKEMNPDNEKKQRQIRSSCRIGCQAKLVIKLIIGNQYVIDKFVQRHNHYLILNLNMGLVRVFKLMKEMYGGFENIGATTTDCKNEIRDMNVFVSEDDAQMAIDKLLNAAIKKVIAKRFLNTQHRLCMWHIMKKLTSKVGPAICSNNSFKRQICDIVWTDKISPEVFEEKWASIMTGFNLQENKSESQNYFFGHLTSTNLTLVEFISHYETAMESRRYMHRKNDHDTMYTTPDLHTNLQIQKEAAELYTSTIFLDVQYEIYASLESCHSVNVTQIDDMKKFLIHDLVDDVIANHVEYNKSTESVTCSYKQFESYGILCRHILYVLRMMKINEFPKKYLLSRWSRDALPPISEESLNKMREYNNSV